MGSSPGRAYDPETEAYFRKKITLALEGIKLRIESNHNGEPQFLEDLNQIDKRTGDRGEQLEKRLILTNLEARGKEDLEAALKRIDAGTFGLCQGRGCGKPIPFKRLDIIPQAKYCLHCQVGAGRAFVPRKVRR